MKEELRVAIVGSRRRNTLADRRMVYALVDKLIVQHGNSEIVIVSGACPQGADEFAASASRVCGLRLVEFPVPKVDYHSSGEFSQAAFKRNKQIAEYCHVAYCFVHPDRKGGTENTISHLRDLRKEYFIVDESGSYLEDKVTHEQKNSNKNRTS
jgi:hypothetical protein